MTKEEAAKKLGLREYSGWLGWHTRAEVLGAWKNGTRVCKVGSEPGDSHQNGSLATVVGSLSDGKGKVLYFVEWDDLPRVASGIAAHRVLWVAPSKMNA